MRSRSKSTWGYAPMPLLPYAIRRRFGSRRAPPALQSDTGATLELKDLDGGFWESHGEISSKAATDLASVFGDLVGVCGEDALCEVASRRSIELASIPLSSRTRSAFKRALANDRIELHGLSFDTLLAMPGIGTRRVLEFSCALETVLAAPEKTPRPPADLAHFFAAMSEWAASERGESTLFDALAPADTRWPKPAVDAWERLRRLELGPPGRQQSRDTAAELFHRAVSQCSELTILVLRARVLASCEPTRLEVLSAALGETPERILELERHGLDWLQRFYSPGQAPVMERAKQLRAAIGVAVPAEAAEVDAAVERIVSDLLDPASRDLAREIMFWLAGPYQKHDGWLLTGSNLVGRSVELVQSAARHDETTAGADVPNALRQLGVLPRYHDLWLDWVREVAGVEARSASPDSAVAKLGSGPAAAG